MNYSLLLEQLARAGGGGSDSEGGGEILALISYVPSYYLGKLIKKLLPRKLELIVSAGFASLFTVIIAILLFGIGFFGIYLGICLIVGIWAGWLAAFFGVWDMLQKRIKKAKKDIDTASSKDFAWNREKLLEHAKQTFFSYQKDWSNNDKNAVKRYMTPSYAYHTGLMIYNLELLGRQNIISDVEIKQIDFVNAQDSDNNSQDYFSVLVEAQAKDVLQRNSDKKILFETKKPFLEYWTFVRSKNDWLLASIEQQTAKPYESSKGIVEFARQNSLYYSLDMGWLFIPENSGNSTLGGSFGYSDINNHCVGMWGDLLVQLYTYKLKQADSWNFLVAQINLPKSYDGIIIQPQNSGFKEFFLHGRQKPPKGYNRYDLEWPDFNKRYLVSAKNKDQLAAFELLNPGFMSFLYDTDAKVTIEAIDNVVYLYKRTDVSKVEDYKRLLEILRRAHKELKL